MSEKQVSLFSFVMRIHELVVLNLLEALYFWLDDGVSGIRVDGFRIGIAFDARLSFLLQLYL